MTKSNEAFQQLKGILDSFAEKGYSEGLASRCFRGNVLPPRVTPEEADIIWSEIDCALELYGIVCTEYPWHSLLIKACGDLPRVVFNLEIERDNRDLYDEIEIIHKGATSEWRRQNQIDAEG